MKRVCVYAGSSFGASPKYAQVAADLGRACAGRGIGIVYGGGSVGLMGALADAALAAGGEVIGVIPRVMVAEERGHHGLTELIAVDSMHERKFRMAELSEGFIALPGGIGTLEEVVEVFTWLQLGIHLKPVGILNFEGFYSMLLGFFDRLRTEGFLSDVHHGMLSVAETPAGILDALAAVKHVKVPKAICRA